MRSKRTLLWWRLTPIGLAVVAGLGHRVIAVPAMMSLLAFYPGHLLMRGLRLDDRWLAGGRVVLSVALSLVVTPVALNLLWRLPVRGTGLLAVIVAMIEAAIWFVPATRPAVTNDSDRRRLFDSPAARWIAVAVGGVLLVATVGPYWPRRVGDWIAPCAIHDFIKHHAVLFALDTGGLPLASPFFSAGTNSPVYYYHFFYLIPATVRAVVGNVSIELVFALHSALVAITLAAMVYCFVKRVSGCDGRATLAMLLATVIGGLDALMVIVFGLRVVTLDAWADHTVRIHNLLNQMMWSPQNVQGLLVGLTGAYLLSCKGWWSGWWWCAPLWCAALVGSSVWVAVPIAGGMVLFVLLDALRRFKPAQKRRALGQALGVGGACAAVCGPMLCGYAEMSRRLGQSLTTNWPHQSHAFVGRLVAPGWIANLLDLPWVLLVEFGALAVLPFLITRATLKSLIRDDGMRLLTLSAAVAVIGFVVVRSHFDYNDFGQKSMMVALLWAAVIGGFAVVQRGAVGRWVNPLGWRLERSMSPSGRIVTCFVIGLCVIVGAGVAVYEVPLTVARRFAGAGGALGRLAAEDAALVGAERSAYLFLDNHLPPDAVLQAHWTRRRLPLVQIADARFGVTELERDTKVFCPPDPTEQQRVLERFQDEIMNGGDGHALFDLLTDMNVTHVFVGIIERVAWPDLQRFDDERYFDVVYHDSSVTLYSLHRKN